MPVHVVAVGKGDPALGEVGAVFLVGDGLDGDDQAVLVEPGDVGHRVSFQVISWRGDLRA